MLDVWQGETLDWPFLVQGGWGQCCGGGRHVHQILPVTQGGGSEVAVVGRCHRHPVGSRRLETWAPPCEVDPGAAGRRMEFVTTFVRRCGWVVAVSWPFSADACL